MQWAFFRIPVTGGDEAIELNRFLRSVRVLNIHREFVGQGDGSYWAMSVEYLPAAESASRSGRDAGMSAAKVDFKTFHGRFYYDHDNIKLLAPDSVSPCLTFTIIPTTFTA